MTTRPGPPTRIPDLLVRPGPALGGRFQPPGDKSITHRACLLGLLATGETRIEHPNPGADCDSTLACAASLGAGVARERGAVMIQGAGGRLAEPDGILDCGNSGTTLRLLAGILAAQPFLSILAGDRSLQRRPVARIIEPLRRMGAKLTARAEGTLPPLVIEGATLRPLDYTLPVPSAQVASCVLLAGLHAHGTTTVRAAGAGRPRDHTERLLPAFGAAIERDETPGRAWSAAVRGPARLHGLRIRVPGDFSAAAFFLAAAAATPGASVTAEETNLNPTRTGLLVALEHMGAQIERTRVREEAGEPVGDVTVTGPERLAGWDVPPELVPSMVDEVPAWMIAASAAAGISRLSGASELRVKESDRLRALASNLAALGGRAEETPDGLAITGGEVRGGIVAAHGDHRIAMAFAVLGARARGPIMIDDASSIATSYPGFVATFAALGGCVEGRPLEPSRR